MADPDPAEAQRLCKELQLLVLQHLHEQGYKEVAHRLEQESGLYLDTKHLEDLVQCGAWDDAERYLGGFTEGCEDPGSAKIFVAIRKQKYLEALGRNQEPTDGAVHVWEPSTHDNGADPATSAVSGSSTEIC